MSSYLDLLRRADQHFRGVLADQPQNLQCRRGCTLCCYGAFEISAADVALIAEGLVQLEPEQRSRILERAEAMIREARQPNLREATEREKHEFFNRSASIPCPALDDSGACSIYENRPLVCRTFGVPLRDGRNFSGEVCELNFTTASDEEKRRAAWDLQWEDELGPDDEFTVAEAVVLASRLLDQK